MREATREERLALIDALGVSHGGDREVGDAISELISAGKEEEIVERILQHLSTGQLTPTR